MTTVELTTARAAKIWWFLFWRVAVLTIICAFVAGLLFGVILLFVAVAEQTKQYIFQSLGVLIGIPIGIWVLTMAFAKSFSDFKIVLVKIDATGDS